MHQPASGSPKFSLGKTVITPHAQSCLPHEEILAALGRHHSGDWGDLSDGDKRENELSLREGFRLLSAYRTNTGEKFWIITEADRSVTTILLPEDY